MVSKTSFKKLADEYSSYAVLRRKVFSASDELLAKSKQAIFAMHRDDLPAAEKLLAEVLAGKAALAPIFKKHPGLTEEGPFRAAVEEYAEAAQFLAFLNGKPLASLPGFDADTVLGGLSDTIGEIARKTVSWATQGDFKKIDRALDTAREVVALLLGLNLTGYLRTKLDQAKQALRRIEDVAYDVSMRRRS